MGIVWCLFVAVMPDQHSPVLPWGGTDFVQYYVAWELVFEGKNPYDREAAASRQMAYGREKLYETYAPPWALLPSLPFASLPLREAIAGFILFNALLLIVGTIAWSSLLLPFNLKSFLFALLCAFLWFPCWATLGFGQLSAWPWIGFTGWLWCTKRRLYFLAGLLLFLLVVKPHLGLLPGVFAGVYLLRQRHWSTLLGFVIALLAATATTLWMRPTMWAEYFSALANGTPPRLFYTATIDGFLRAHVSESFKYLTWSLWIAALGLTAVIAWRIFDPARRQWDKETGGQGEKQSPSPLVTLSPCPPALLSSCPLVSWAILACLATLVFVPYAFHFDYIFMLPGFILAIGSWLENQRQGRIALAIWIALAIGLMSAFSAEWPQDYFWLISWTGLGATIWLIQYLTRTKKMNSGQKS